MAGHRQQVRHAAGHVGRHRTVNPAHHGKAVHRTQVKPAHVTHPAARQVAAHKARKARSVNHKRRKK
jgi:hypothetical protein